MVEFIIATISICSSSYSINFLVCIFFVILSNSNGTEFLREKNIEDGKKFLLQYCEEDKSLAGYKLVPDQLSMYYETVYAWVWFGTDSFFSDQDFFQSSPLPHRKVPSCMLIIKIGAQWELELTLLHS
ncbi:hypothetical protein SAY87_029102 [Trapa incisa]|uniref:Uncharacterized protein n=1 Tax=Trapa incisa TaxID=236973 RepID=A0AAN7L0Y7_9MYRT|nr:hypothetical protein SAY87_029102 [Trapa incisa]